MLGDMHVYRLHTNEECVHVNQLFLVNNINSEQLRTIHISNCEVN